MKKAVCLYNQPIYQNIISMDSRIDTIRQCFGDDVDIYIHSSPDVEPIEFKAIKKFDFSGFERSNEESDLFMSNSRGLVLDQKSINGVRQIFSKWFSMHDSVKMAIDEGGYDCISAVDINMIMMRKFFSDEEFEKEKEKVMVPLWNMNEYRCAFLDLLCIANPQNMTKVISIKDRLFDYLSNGSDFEKFMSVPREVAKGVQSSRNHMFSTQTLFRWHLIREFGNNIRFWGMKGIDYDLIFSVGKNETGYDRPVLSNTKRIFDFEEGQMNLCGPSGV